MLLLTDRKNHMSLWICVFFLTVWNVEGQTTNSPSISCPKSQLLCGGNLCYDPATQYCSALGTVIQCIAACGNQCYNPAQQQCFNGTLCSITQQLCNMKYDSLYGTLSSYSYATCYDPKYQSCIDNFLCSSTQVCKGRCMGILQVCAENTTVCNVTYSYSAYQPNQVKLCNGVCYDSAIQQCKNNVVSCLNACAGVCYNSSTQQCFNGTLCSITQQLCNMKYDSLYGTLSSYSYAACYDPKYQSCIDNFLCSSTQVCKGRCMGVLQVCAENTTVCNVTYSYSAYQPNQFKLCNGVCYDSAIQQCKNNVVSCLNTCAGVCFNSSTQQCFNGTLCSITQQLCNMKYDNLYGTLSSYSYAACYDPKYQSCIDNFLCSSTQVCKGRCMGILQVCAENTTVCNVTYSYSAYQPNQFKLCNGVCYDSAIQRCVGGYIVNCIRDSFTQQCINESTTITTTPSSNTTFCNSSGSCPTTDCTTDADCCVSGKECQCFKHNNEEYGYCLNPIEQPISTKGCSTQARCKNDIDCCKCKCGTVTMTNGGELITKKQCVSP